MKKFEAVIFDLDDTLYPEIDYVISGFKVVSKFISNITKIKSEQVFSKLVELFNQDRKNVFNRLLELYDIDKKLVEDCINLYRNHYPNIKLNGSIHELLQLLKKNKFKIGIITDGRPEAQWNKIKALDLKQYCNCIIVTDELGGIEYRKPSEVPYEKMLQELGIQAQEAIYVGDNPAKDFITANKLGIFTVMLKNNQGLYNQIDIPKEYMAKITINELNEIKGLLNLE